MKTSSNYGLKLMEGTDNVKRQDFVDNFTKIDTTMKTIADSGFPLVNATGTNAYTGTNTNIKSLTKGITKFTLFVGVDANGNCSLNLNSWGVKSIKDSFGNIVTNLKKDIPYNICYNGTDFILQGKGGGGNVQPSEVLNGKTFTNDKGPGVGTMPNNGSINATLNAGQSKAIPKGYTDGGTITVNSLASQTQATAGAGDILSGKTAIVNGNKVTGNMANNPAQTSANSIGVNNNNCYIRIPKGAYMNDVGNGYSEIITPYSMIANAIGVNANAILSDNSVLGVTGNIPNRGSVQDAGGFGVGTDYYAMNHIPWGFYPNYGDSWAPEVRVPKDTVRNALGISPNKIVSGQQIADVWGNVTAVDLLVTGTLPNIGMGSSASVNLPFTPRVVFATFYNGYGGASGYSSIVYSNNFSHLDNNNSGNWGQYGIVRITFSGTTMIVNNASSRNFVCAGFRWCAIQ